MFVKGSFACIQVRFLLSDLQGRQWELISSNYK
jgi:hypothetical protein